MAELGNGISLLTRARTTSDPFNLQGETLLVGFVTGGRTFTDVNLQFRATDEVGTRSAWTNTGITLTATAPHVLVTGAYGIEYQLATATAGASVYMFRHVKGVYNTSDGWSPRMSINR